MCQGKSMDKEIKELEDIKVLPEVVQSLLPQQRKFSYYLALYDQPAKAARLAQYSGDHAYVLAGRADIQEAVAYYRMVLAEASESAPEKVAAELARMAYVDITRYVEDDWTPKRPSQLTEAQRCALTGIEIIRKKDGLTLKPKFAKMQALE